MTIPEFGIVFAIVCLAVLGGWACGWRGGYDAGRDELLQGHRHVAGCYSNHNDPTRPYCAAGLVEQEERWADVDEARLQEAE